MADKRPVASFGRRSFIAAVMGTTVAAALDAHAAPLLGMPGKRRAVAANAWIEVDPVVFEHNLGLVQAALAGGARLCAIVKADAYGIGIDMVMPSLIKARVPYVGIASNEEARMVRACGFKGAVMRVRAGTPDEVEAARPYRVEELVGNLNVALAMGARARKRGHALRVHLALNAGGMSRNGLDMVTERDRQDARELVETPGLRVVGMMTHFPVEERADVLKVLDAFGQETAWLFANTALRREEVLLHTANSFATLHVPEAHLDMTRTGGALYGYGGTDKPPFAHVAAFKSRVASVNAYRAGETVSYDRTFVLQRDSLLANLPVGYSDGYRRAYSNKGSVLVRGRRAPVVGRVTMNTTMVDVTDIPGVEAGDEAVLFGRQGDDQITQAEIEALTGVILADQYTVWGATNPKRLRR
ncbi:alanine racemase [Pseudoxanthomonas sp.]|uniref:alanine racemase n=1 Tax=Pseudoxanthomonas sp. TaxID=1871049 RepID=UPI002FE0443B